MDTNVTMEVLPIQIGNSLVSLYTSGILFLSFI